MSVAGTAESAGVVDRLHAVLDEVQALELTPLSEGELLSLWREVERARRRFPTVEASLVAEVETRGVPQAAGLRGVPQLLRGLLRLDPGEAAGRVRAARAIAERRPVSGGDRLPAQLPVLAAAQAAGVLSPRQARVVVEAVAAIPVPIREAEAATVEAELVELAGRFDPQPLSRLAARILDCLDPDGTHRDEQHRARLRHLALQRRTDGSAWLSGELTAECAEALLAHWDALAAPAPPVDGVRDPRTAGQRRHDALLEALRLNLRARALPSVAGVSTTLVVTLTAQQYATGRGLAVTGHGALIPARDALDWAGGDYRLLAVVLDSVNGITGISSSRRLFGQNQRLALAAADGGCSFPGCSIPAAWCEVDHCRPWSEGGPTSLDNAVLVCRYHHRHAKAQGWTTSRINGRAAWTPPRWLDPTRRPRHNDLHRPLRQ